MGTFFLLTRKIFKQIQKVFDSMAMYLLGISLICEKLHFLFRTVRGAPYDLINVLGSSFSHVAIMKFLLH